MLLKFMLLLVPKLLPTINLLNLPCSVVSIKQLTFIVMTLKLLEYVLVKHQQFVVQICCLFDHWFDSCVIPERFEDLCEFLIVDQLGSIVPVALLMY